MTLPLPPRGLERSMNENEVTKFREGDVVRYDTLSRPNRHCREGMAIVQRSARDGHLYLADTYWQGMGDDHLLTPGELATAEVLFNMGDYRELGYHEYYDDYRPEDRARITSQHGLSERRFLKIGAERDWPTRLANAELDVEEAARKVDSATSGLESAVRYLNDLRGRAAEGVSA